MPKSLVMTRASSKKATEVRVPELRAITPLVPVANLDSSVEFFTETLGFEAVFRMEGYAYLKRDQVAIRLLKAAFDTQDPARQQSCYIDVEELDALYAELKSKLDQLPEGRVRAPFNQDYGQREFHVTDEDCLLIFFGEAIDSKQ